MRQTIAQGFNLFDHQTQEDLQSLQQYLKLTDQEVAAISESISAQTEEDLQPQPETSPKENCNESVEGNSSRNLDNSLDSITLDDVANMPEVSLDEINFDDVETNSTSNLNDELDVDAKNISLDDLGFEESESADSLSADPLSNNRAKITNLSDDQSNDMNNVSKWLDSLETPKQSTDHISKWLNTINADDKVDSAQKEQNQDTTTKFAKEADDIHFKFLEDLLDRDPNPNQDDQ